MDCECRLSDRGKHSPTCTRSSSATSSGFRSFSSGTGNLDERLDETFSSEPLRRGTLSASGPLPPPLQSPAQPLPPPLSRSNTLLPSPSSLAFPSAPSLPSSPSAAHAHLQELQHQITLKTLAFQTLQREYDGLLAQLSHQHARCASLEQQITRSDAELASLREEKERIQSQVLALERQVEELKESREEARRQLGRSGAQYVRIVEMAGRLQAQGAEERRGWEEERGRLEGRIRALEEAVVRGGGAGGRGDNSERDHGADDGGTEMEVDNTSTSALAGGLAPNSSAAISTSTPASAPTVAENETTVSVLRSEISRLRARTKVLEEALQAMRQECVSVQTAARMILESGERMERVVVGS